MIRLLRVRGQSLTPQIEDGDFVLALKFPIFFSIRAGELILFRKAPYGVLIKRVEAVDEQGRVFWVRGNHPDSIDSRTFGVVRDREVLGKIVARLSKS